MRTPNKNISNLIASYIKGEITDIQKEELDIWLENSKNKQLFDEIVTKERILDKCNDYDAFDMNKAWIQIDQKISKKTDYRKWLAYAAVILLPLAIGFLVLNQVTEHEPMLAEVKPITPGESNAVIYFSNGEIVNLQNDTSSVIRSEENLLVERNNNQLRINDDQLLASSVGKMNRIVTPIGGEYEVVLPDGTKVYLNADSYLEFPSKFSEKERRVIAKGELYFDVASNKEWPFIVEAKGMNLKVLGTEFNVRAYSEESEIISTLVEGSVLVNNSLGENTVLKPGYQAVISKANNSIKNIKANIEEAIAWKNGRFIFDNRRVEDIMYDLARWYDVKVFFANASVKEKRFSVDVQRYGEVEEILKLIQGTGEANFTVNGNTITVE
ncbi:MAG: FecR domain-containing protein [Labilibaculum sp.]|nr:FecR domain-containing protein [Labilibaculum sp.]MBI9057202.1 FecR domain-containing protein [Labilibaculum sp.]